MTPSSADDAARELLARWIAGWNARDAAAMADTLTPEALVVGFDGSVIEGRERIRDAMAAIFAHHPTGRYVSLPGAVVAVAPGVVRLTGAAGIVPAGRDDLEPALNAVQTLLAVVSGGTWRTALFQNTPAQFHGRPEAAQLLTRELRARLAQG